MDKFIRCDPKKVAKITSFKWAIDKTIAITEALALSLGNLEPNTENDHHAKNPPENPKGGNNDHRDTGKAGRGAKVTFKDDQDNRHHQYHGERPDDRLAMAFDNLAATIVNTRERKEQELQNDSWAFKAV
jgi:hypothetical protein